MNTVVEHIQARLSNPNCTSETLPEELILNLIRCGASANDHGRLRPWKFLVFRGEGRGLLEQAYSAHDLSEGHQIPSDKALKGPYRAPVVICVVCQPKPGRIPVRDQLMSAAAACQLITLAADDLSLAAFWRTGKYADSHVVKKTLGLDISDEITGFIYLGYPSRTIENPRSLNQIDVKFYD